MRSSRSFGATGRTQRSSSAGRSTRGGDVGGKSGEGKGEEGEELSAPLAGLAALGGTGFSFDEVARNSKRRVDLDRRAPPKPRPTALFRTLPVERADAWRSALSQEGTSPARFPRKSGGSRTGALNKSASLPAIGGNTGGTNRGPASPDKPPRAVGDPAVSHFAVQTGNHLWQYVGRVQPAVQRPMPRRNVLDLHHTYARSMETCVAAGATAAEGMEPEAVRGDPVLAQDFMNMRSEADEFVCSSFPDTSERLRAAGLSAGSAFRRGNALVWQLASVMVMQKWTDLTASEVETQVSMSCIEHADLLHAIREGTGGMHSTTLGLVSSLLQRVGSLENLVLDKQSELDAMRAEMQVHESKMEQLFQQKLESATAKLTAERDDAESYATDARAQVSRLQDALSTLNSIYKQLREDNDTVRVADLRDACSRLETRLKERDAQVTMLNKIRSELRHANMLVRTYKGESERLARELEETQEELTNRNVLAQEVMQRESERLAEIEHLTKSGGGGGGGARPDTASSALTGPPGQSRPASRARIPVHSEQKPHHLYPMLCVRCHSALDELRDVDDEEGDREEGRKHPACMYYRMLLPQTIERHSRPAAWTFWCMRAIILSKMTSDMIAEREGRLRPRMPEFVYGWFEGVVPEETVREEMAGDAGGPSGTVSAPLGSAAAAAEAARTQQRRDEERWAFYYCVRCLARNYPEAKLFYNFLDEKYGEDELTFYLYCLRVLDGHLSLPLQWGPTTYSASRDALPPALLSLEPLDVKPRRRGGPPREKPALPQVPFVPDMVWVGLSDAVNAADTVLARAKDEDRKSAIWRLQGKAQPSIGRLYKLGKPASNPGGEGSAMGMLQGLDGEDQVMEELVNKGQATLVGVPEGEAPKESKCVDLGTFLRVMLLEYREEQAHRRAAIRLMFDTAVGAIVAARDKLDGDRPGDAYRDEAEVRRAKREAKRWEGGYGPGEFTGISVDFPQVLTICRNVHSMVTINEAAALYRDAYEIGRGGVNYESFMAAAEHRQLFSLCLRLPAAYGSNPLQALSKSQAAQLAAVVQKHFRTLDIDVLPLLGADNNLPAEWVDRIRRALFKVEMEIADSGHGLKTDGRRSLVAYRRLLDLLGWIRLCNREIRGEDNDNLSVVRVDKELTSLEGVLRRDVAGLNASFSEAEMIEAVRNAIAAMPTADGAALGQLARQGSHRVIAAAASKDKPKAGSTWNFLQELCKVVCVVRIQRTFRARFRSDLGVPWSLRKLMRPGYRPLGGPRRSPITPKGGHRLREMSLDSVLGAISQMFLEKLRADALDLSRHAQSQTLPEFVYDFYLNKTGVRELAELHLHDFFTSLRRFVPLHSRVRLFANFVGVVSAAGGHKRAEEMTLAMPEAFEFYLKLLHRLQAKSARNRRMSTNFLFPRAAPGTPRDAALVMWVESGLARAVVEKAMSSLNDPEGTAALLERMYEAETAGQVDLDVVLDLCMTEWAKNAISRQHLLENLFKVSQFHRGDTLSLDEFQDLIHRIDPDKAPTDIVRLFREASTLRAAKGPTNPTSLRATLSRASLRSSAAATPMDGRSRRASARAGAGAGSGAGAGGGGGESRAADNGGAALTKRQFMEICRKYGLATAAIQGDLRVPPSVDKRGLMNLLKESWESVEKEVVASVDKQRSTMTTETERFVARFDKFQERYAVIVSGDTSSVEEVEQAWLAYRLMMGDWNRIRKMEAAEEAAEAATRAMTLSMADGGEDVDGGGGAEDGTTAALEAVLASAGGALDED